MFTIIPVTLVISSVITGIFIIPYKFEQKVKGVKGIFAGFVL